MWAPSKPGQTHKVLVVESGSYELFAQVYITPMTYPIARVINLIPPESQRLWSSTEAEAQRRLLETEPSGVLEIEGSFALVAQEGERLSLIHI